MIFGHGGNIYEAARQLNCQPSDIIDMSSNINPFIRTSLKQSDVNRLLGERLSSLTKNAGLELTAGRIAY